MSYILDAIKKAEQQRNKDRMPTLESIVTFDSNEGRRTAGRMVTVTVAAIILVALGWFHKPVLDGLSNAFSSTAGWISGLFSGSDETTPPPPEPGQQQQASATGLAGAPSPTQEASLKSISFSVISYSSDPNKRFVMEGNQVLREGQAVNGFPILEIRKSSVILEVNTSSYRFEQAKLKTLDHDRSLGSAPI